MFHLLLPALLLATHMPSFLSDCGPEQLPPSFPQHGLTADLPATKTVPEGGLVSYSCNGTRKVRSTADLTAVCLLDKYTLRFTKLTEQEMCQCDTDRRLYCRGASHSLTYPLGSDRTATLDLVVPGLEAADPSVWKITVYLDTAAGFYPTAVQSSEARATLSGNKLILTSNGQPTSKNIQLKISLPGSGPVYKWQFPCVKDVGCSMPHESVASLEASIVISSVFCGLTVMMFACVKGCQCKAKSNDRKTAVEERLRPKPSENRLVVTVPAAHQACRINNPHLYRNVDQRQREALHNFANRGSGQPSPSQPHNLANRGQLSQREMEDGTRQKEAHAKRSLQKEREAGTPYSYNSFERRGSFSGGSRRSEEQYAAYIGHVNRQQIVENGHSGHHHKQSHHRSKSWERSKREEEGHSLNMSQVWKSQVNHR